MENIIKVNGHLCDLKRFNSANRTLSITSPFFGPGIIHLGKGTAKKGLLNYRDYRTGKFTSCEVTL